MKNWGGFLTLAITSISAWSQVGIGTTDPDPNTILDIVSSNKGMNFPRLTTAERDANLADNDPDTDYPINDPVLDPIPLAADQLVDGTMIFNTDFDALQYWNATDERWSTLNPVKGYSAGNDGTVLMNFAEFNDSDAVQINLSADVFSEVIYNDVDITVFNSDGSVSSNQSNVTYTEENSVFGPEVALTFDEDDFTLAAAPVTQWPENERSPGKSAIWDETENQIFENSVTGQVHLWRLVIQYEVPGGNAQKSSFQARIYNPNPASTFTTQSTTSVLDGRNNTVVNSTFLFVTVADSFSLPGGADGGEGYKIGFASNADLTISIRSILRISLYKD